MVAISPVNAPVDPNHVAQGLKQNANPGIEGGIVDDPRTPEEGQVQPDQTKQVADKTDPMAPFTPQPTQGAAPMAPFNPQPTPKAPIDPAPAAYQQRLAQGSTLYDNVKALSEKRGKIDPTLKEQAKAAWDKIAGGYSDSHSDDFWTRLMSVPKIGAGVLAGASLPFSVPISKADALLAQTPGGLFKPGDLETALMGLPAGEPAALVDAGAGQTSRIVTDTATGAMKGQVIGEFPPKPEDFTNAAHTITAYHGSPHSFDAFSMDKIGTGEGAQSYGHGLYFAENPEVAKSYRPDLEKVAAAIKGEIPSSDIPEGTHYQVRIHADKNDMLDLDKSLDEQTPKVQASLKQAMGIDYYGNFDQAKSERLWNEFKVAKGKVAVRQGFIAGDDKLVADRLREAGIPGSKYLDQGSRAGGEGTHNLVVFSDKDVEITHKNGLPIQDIVEQNLRDKWTNEGLHPAEVAMDAEHDAFLAHDLGTAGVGPDTLLYQGVRHPSKGGPLPEEPQRSEYWTSKIGMAKNFAGPGGFVRVAKWGDFPEHAQDRGISNGVATSLKLGESGKPATISQIPELGRLSYEEAVAKDEEFKAHDLGAAANTEPTMPPLVSPLEQPLSPVGKLMQAGRAGVDKLIDIGTDIQAKLDPMAVGSRPAQAIATDVANTERRIAWDHARTDKWISDNFSPESRERMWNAIDEQSVAEQRGESTEHQGLATLEPHEQELVRALQEHSKRTWETAREIGMVKGEGLPSYGPRIMINMLADVESKTPVALGRPISTRTSNMIARKYLTAEETEAAGKNITEGGQLIRDVRTLPLVTARMERAIMWHKAITKIEEMGATTGNNTVWSGPLAEGMDRKDWFTRPEPAFQTWQPLLERGKDGTPLLSGNMLKVVKNADGEDMYERVPRYIHKDFQGPLDAIIQKPYGPALSALMNLKGKTTSLVMYSPVIHNLVEFSRSLPAVNGNPIKLVRLYFDGNAVKNNPAMMREAIDGGLVPIGKRFFNQDMFATAETPDLTPGRSWTAQIAGFFPEMYSPEAGAAVKRGIDAAGDFWHNTLLWDRVADLQAGLYKNFLDEFGAIPGIDRSSAVRASAHFANRFAGSLPAESMSRGARTVANVALFSRTFTMGNYALFKDALMGLPGNVGAQIERAVSPEVFRTLNTKSKRLAQHAIITDVALKYVTGSLLASGLAVMASDQDWGGALSEVYHGYVKRFQTTFDKATEHPLSILAHPFDTVNSLTPMSENEPGKEDKIKLPWRMPDGSAMYATNPAGKIADQYIGSIFHPIDTLHGKLSTFAKPVWDVLADDKGFGRKIFDPEYTDNAARFQSALDVAKIIAEDQIPTGQLAAFGRLVSGDGDAKFNDLQALGPFFGANVSQGTPGGEHKAVLYQAQQAEKFRIDQAMPDIKKAVQDGDNEKAREIMTGLGMSNRYQNAIIHYQSNPAKVSGSAERDLMRYGTQEEKDRFQMFKSQQ